MDSKELILDLMRDLGNREATELRQNASEMDGTATLPSLWNLCHTKDPTRAKPWFAPNGQSGMYMTGECYLAKDGKVYRCKQDNCVWDADGLPSAWEEVELEV